MLNLPYDMPIHKYDINEWLYKLSKKEFNIFLNEIIFCDGNSRTNNSGEIYGDEKILNIYQLLCLNYGIKTKLKFVERTDGKRNYWKLCINKRNKYKLNTKNLNKVEYKGYVYCVNNKNDTIITRKDGNILISGNSRIKKDFDLDICKILATVLDCEYNIGGLYQQITVNNKKLSVYVTHGKGSSSRDELALGKVKRETNHISADINFYGHLHRTSYISDVYYINQEYKRKYYILTGSTLNYKSSYAEENGLKPIPMGFSRVNVDYNGRISVDCFNHDELNIMDQTNDGFSVDFNLEESSDYNYNFTEFKNKFSTSLSKNSKSLPVATRKKISNTMSESLNKSGYYRVSKKKNNKLKQGFTYRYQYYDEDGYHKCLSSKSLTKLEAKVKEHGLEWRKL